MARSPNGKASRAVTQSRNTKQLRNASGQYVPAAEGGSSAPTAADATQARRLLNRLSLTSMAQAWAQGGDAAVRKVMLQQPAMFVKLALLTLPREMEITQKQGPKAMSDEAIASAIQAIEAMLSRRLGDSAKLIEAKPEPSAADDPSASST